VCACVYMCVLVRVCVCVGGGGVYVYEDPSCVSRVELYTLRACYLCLCVRACVRACRGDACCAYVHAWLWGLCMPCVCSCCAFVHACVSTCERANVRVLVSSHTHAG